MQILKNNKSRVFLAATVAALTLLVGTAAVAGPFGGHGKEPARVKRYLDLKVEDVLDDLDATPQQKVAAQAVVDRVFDEGLKLHADKKQRKDELRALLAAEDPDADQLHAMVDEESARMTAFAHKMADATLELHGILTPEQRAALLEEMDRHHQKHGWR